MIAVPEFVKTGIGLTLILMVVVLVLLPVFWPFAPAPIRPR